MKKWLILIIFCLSALNIFGQSAAPQKYALIIGNGNYTNITKLNNPVNDANDMEAVLKSLGFHVNKVLNGSLDQMESAIIKFKTQLSMSRNSYGFLFYAGHGVQSGGENFLIPVDANIQTENFLKQRAVSVQAVLDEINDAGNELNIVVLDACRDNPFSWKRSGSRGLTLVSNQPADSIIVFATSAGSTAADGDSRNGLFTSHLLNHIRTPNVEITEIFRRTMGDVARASNNQQRPAVYNQYYGTAYFGERPQPGDTALAVQPVPLPSQPGKPESRKKQNPDEAAKKLWTIGASLGSSFADPWLITSVHGTLAPFRNSFLELGADFGFISSFSEVEKYFSFHPFVHYAYYLPVSKKIGLYAGAGGGCLIASYYIPSRSLDNITVPVPALDLVAGAIFFNALNISYTFRTDFKDPSNKMSVGYVYRFK